MRYRPGRVHFGLYAPPDPGRPEQCIVGVLGPVAVKPPTAVPKGDQGDGATGQHEQKAHEGHSDTARAITFQLAGSAVTGPMVRAILGAVQRLRAPPGAA